jgi:hypothetical protein
MEVMTTIRPKVSLYSAIGAGLVTLSAIIPTMFAGAWAELPGLLCTLAIIDVAVWLIFINPRIQFDENRVIVTNPLRVFTASWGAIKGFETRFGLTFVTQGKKFVAWSAPAPSRREIRRVDKRDLRGTELANHEFVEPGLIRGFESGNAYWQFEQLRENATTEASVKISVNWLTLAGIVAIALLAYIDLHL